ncbi:major facilitator transporter [Achromobacter insuavis AXX-A]|uniref:Major facilitator transporter n=1 Tax=Achromobacter insuavis AXX-A TaxID=1003200 RepID=F7T941_9BURK|nr:major facilitator transporter [Achromobacter insuavis AXX-A]
MTSPHHAAPPPWARLAAIAALYVSLGAVLGFVQGGIGPILRGKGHTLASMAPVFALYLPFGVTFLWAPLVDRWRLPWLGRRSGWIVAAQGLAVLLVAAIALGGALPLAALFGLGLATTLAVATMDVALDAWTVEHIGAPHRGAASAAKVGGLSLGAVLGRRAGGAICAAGLGRGAAVAGRRDGAGDAAGLAPARPRRAGGVAAGATEPARGPAPAGHGRPPAAHQPGHVRADGAVQPEPADAGGPGRAAGAHRLGAGGGGAAGQPGDGAGVAGRVAALRPTALAMGPAGGHRGRRAGHRHGPAHRQRRPRHRGLDRDQRLRQRPVHRHGRPDPGLGGGRPGRHRLCAAVWPGPLRRHAGAAGHARADRPHRLAGVLCDGRRLRHAGRRRLHGGAAKNLIPVGTKAASPVNFRTFPLR